jgi:hypothetical protein
LLVISILILAIAIITSIGIFLYAQYLTSVENTKSAELVSAQSTANPATIQAFLRLSNRLTAAKSLMNQHVELSQFFTLLGTVTEQDVTFNSLSITVADDRSAQLELAGTAKDFNALASESNLFAAQKDIKSAIFSGITLNPKDNTVGFTVDATLDPSIVVEAAAPTTPTILPAVVASSTAPAAPSIPAASSTPPATPASSASKTPAPSSSSASAATTSALAMPAASASTVASSTHP